MPYNKDFAKDVLANSIVALEALKEASGAISVVPLLSSVVGAALGLLRTVEVPLDVLSQSYYLLSGNERFGCDRKFKGYRIAVFVLPDVRQDLRHISMIL